MNARERDGRKRCGRTGRAQVSNRPLAKAVALVVALAACGCAGLDQCVELEPAPLRLAMGALEVGVLPEAAVMMGWPQAAVTTERSSGGARYASFGPRFDIERVAE